MNKRFSRQGKKPLGKNTKKLLTILTAVKEKKVSKSKAKSTTNEIRLSRNLDDKIVYSYELDEKGKYSSVLNVSYVVKIDGNWITVVRYDSKHGFLHRHIRKDVNKPMKQDKKIEFHYKDEPHRWLTWSINDLKMNFTRYKITIIKSRKLVDKK